MKNKIIMLGIVILLLLSCGHMLLSYSVHKAANMTISDPDLTTLSDGNYLGEYTLLPVFVQVQVTIQAHVIKDIQILQHQNGLGTSAEAITDTVITAQSLAVDTVSGATVSSQCILKAIENALTKGE